METKRIIPMVVVLCAVLLAAGSGVSYVGAQQQSQSDEAQAQGASAEQGQQMAEEVAETEGTRLYVSPSTLQVIQKQLNIKGFATGGADGVWGEKTAEAISKFQRVQGLEPTGNLNLQTLDYLRVARALRGSPQRILSGEGAPLFISPSDVREVQRQLSKNGFDPGPIDGIWGPNTQKAVADYEEAQGMEATGNINLSMISTIGLDQMVAGLTGTDQQGQQARGYYGQAPEGPQPIEGFIKLKGPKQQQFAGEGAPLFVSAEVVQQIQEKLSEAGFAPGNTKGKWDTETSQAIRNYQEAKGLEPTGNLNISSMNTILGGLSGDMLQPGQSEGQSQQQ